MHVRISCPGAEAGRCIELAKNAPIGQKRARGGRPAKADRSAHKAPKAAAGNAQRKSRKGAPGNGKAAERGRDEPPRAARGSAQVPMMLDAIDEAILQGAGLSRDEPEAEADGAEVRDAIDESGAPKITD
jgi:penicillin-insensitive murein endopeptidase